MTSSWQSKELPVPGILYSTGEDKLPEVRYGGVRIRESRHAGRCAAPRPAADPSAALGFRATPSAPRGAPGYLTMRDAMRSQRCARGRRIRYATQRYVPFECMWPAVTGVSVACGIEPNAAQPSTTSNASPRWLLRQIAHAAIEHIHMSATLYKSRPPFGSMLREHKPDDGRRDQAGPSPPWTFLDSLDPSVSRAPHRPAGQLERTTK